MILLQVQQIFKQLLQQTSVGQDMLGQALKKRRQSLQASARNRGSAAQINKEDLATLQAAASAADKTGKSRGDSCKMS